MAKIRSDKYDTAAVGKYWSQRLRETDPLAAVLTFDAPPPINEAYHAWEIGSFQKELRRRFSKRRSLARLTALDIGCGIGRITRVLARAGAQTSAIDLSPDMIASCKKRNAGHNIRFAVASADVIPFADSSFDVITCFGLLEHLPEKPRTGCMAEIARLLKRGGRAYVVVNNRDCIFLQDRRPGTKRRGYHVELVGLEWLRQAARKMGGTISVCSANSGYAVAHYQILSCRRSSGRLTWRERMMIDAVQPLNELIPPESTLARSLASHFLVEFSLRK